MEGKLAFPLSAHVPILKDSTSVFEKFPLSEDNIYIFTDY